jgi:hypothetical protein
MNHKTKSILFSTLLLWATLLARADNSYDFLASGAYQQLSAADRSRLEQVRRDQVLLWGALDLFADHHDGELPATLDDLVPKYLAELPADPFATQQTASEPMSHGYTSSKGGWGYHFKRGSAGNRAWVISSVGLPDFPYLAARGNVGLYICKGEWISGKNPIMRKAKSTQ